MKKTITTLLAFLMLVLVASCGGRLKPQEIGGYAFSGKGVFGDVPYLLAYHALSKMTSDYEAVDDAVFLEPIHKRDSFSVECDVMQGANIVSKATVLFKADNQTYVSENGCHLRYSTILPESVGDFFAGANRIHVVGLDEDGEVISNYYRYNTYNLGKPYSSLSGPRQEEKCDKYVKRLYDWDRIVRLVLTDDEGLNLLKEKSADKETEID